VRLNDSQAKVALWLAGAITSASAFVPTPGCGSRSAVNVTPGPPPPPECTQNRDCPGFDDLCAPVFCQEETCQSGPAKDCDDHDACTLDTCDSATGVCTHDHVTLDLDGDGYYAPLPGKRPTDPDSCGTDCDDTNAAAHPGGTEVCDGVDNDCNGVVDDGAALVATGSDVLVSEATNAGPESLVGRGSGYLGAYSGEINKHHSVYLALLDANGSRAASPIQFSTVAADAFGGPLAWTGDRFGIAWSDRRDARGSIENYEIYFNLVNPDGSKRIADVRVTQANGFSISPSLAWTGNEFVVLWQDDGMGSGGVNTAFGQRIDVNGAPLGGNVRLDPSNTQQLTPTLAAGQRSIGIVWVRGPSGSQRLMFAPFDQNLRSMATPVELSGSMMQSVRPSIVFNRGQYVITWHDEMAGNVIYGAVKGELGGDVVATKVLIRSNARYPSILPFGDRLLMVWSDARDGNQGYELYAKTLDPALNPLQPDTRLTRAPGDSVDPIVAYGPNGDAGVLFTDYRGGPPQAYFTRLACVTAPLR
jgi:hypothetical protein